MLLSLKSVHEPAPVAEKHSPREAGKQWKGH